MVIETDIAVVTAPLEPLLSTVMRAMVNTASADSDNEPVACFVAIELSKSAWVLGFQTPLSDKTSRHQVKAGDAQALLQPTPIAPEERALVSALPPEDRPEIGPVKPLPPQFSRATIEYRTKEPAGTIIIDTPHTYLYLVLGNGKFTAPTSRRRSGHSYHRDASGSQMKISWTFIAESE